MATSTRQKLFAAVVAAPMALGAVTGLAPNDAQAGVTCPAEITVPCADARGAPLDEVRYSAAVMSVDQNHSPPQPRTVLVYYGDDEKTRQAGIDVLNHLNNVAPGPNGEKTFGLLLADGGIGGNDFQVFIGGYDLDAIRDGVPSPANAEQKRILSSAIFETIQSSAEKYQRVIGPSASLEATHNLN